MRGPGEGGTSLCHGNRGHGLSHVWIQCHAQAPHRQRGKVSTPSLGRKWVGLEAEPHDLIALGKKWGELEVLFIGVFFPTLCC